MPSNQRQPKHTPNRPKALSGVEINVIFDQAPVVVAIYHHRAGIRVDGMQIELALPSVRHMDENRVPRKIGGGRK